MDGFALQDSQAMVISSSYGNLPPAGGAGWKNPPAHFVSGLFPIDEYSIAHGRRIIRPAVNFVTGPDGADFL